MINTTWGYAETVEQLSLHNKAEIHETIERLKMPTDSYFVLGGASMVLRGIKLRTEDVDVLVSDDMFKLLQFVDGAKIKQPPLPAITRGANNTTVWVKNSSLPVPLSATTSLGDGYYPMSFETHHNKIELVEGVPCIVVDELIFSKLALQRPKDLTDIEAIGTFLGRVIELPPPTVHNPWFSS